MCVLSHFSHVRLFVTPWTVAHQAPLSIGFSRQEYWSGWLCPPPGDLPNPEIKFSSLTSPALEDGFLTTSHHLRSPDMDIICPYLYPYLYVSAYLYLLCPCPYIYIHTYTDIEMWIYNRYRCLVPMVRITELEL